MELSTDIKQRFQLQSMSADWQSWFDSDWHSAELLGEFEHQILPTQLCSESGFPALAGLIPPDCIPIVGNGYGDWICVRVKPENSLGELIHWYHGGGDWIPVGKNLPQAMLHDFIDQYRPQSNQMLRGAAEMASPSIRPLDPAEALRSSWFAKHTDSIHGIDLVRIVEHLKAGQHACAVRLLVEHDVAYEAACCDLVEHSIASPLSAFATPKQAAACGLEWSPAYLRLLFDFDTSPQSSQAAFIAAFGDVAGNASAQQDWNAAGQIASDLIKRRTDLGWARDVAGWAEQRQGNTKAAIHIYQQGECASTFSDQAVRLRSHWYPSNETNFSTAQLSVLAPNRKGQVDDSYPPPESTSAWIERGNALHAKGEFAAAYDAFFSAGWGIGFRSLAECTSLLQLLIENADAAGWSARAATAAAHLEVVRSRSR